MIEKELSRRRIFKYEERYYADQRVDGDDARCNVCQVI